MYRHKPETLLGTQFVSRENMSSVTPLHLERASSALNFMLSWTGPACPRALTRTQAGNRAGSLPRYSVRYGNNANNNNIIVGDGGRHLVESPNRCGLRSSTRSRSSWGALSVLSSHFPLPKVPLEFVQRTLARQRWRLKGAFRKLGSDDPMLHAM